MNSTKDSRRVAETWSTCPRRRTRRFTATSCCIPCQLIAPGLGVCCYGLLNGLDVLQVVLWIPVYWMYVLEVEVPFILIGWLIGAGELFRDGRHDDGIDVHSRVAGNIRHHGEECLIAVTSVLMDEQPVKTPATTLPWYNAPVFSLRPICTD